MNTRLFQLWLVLASATSGAQAFTPAKLNKMDGKTLDMTATLDIRTRNEIDISNVLAEVESALQMAQETVPKSKTIGKEIMNFAKIQDDVQKKMMEAMDIGSSGSSSGQNDQLVATAIAGSAIGVVAGSPLVVGAALGYAGSQWLDGEQGEKNRIILEQVGLDVAGQLQGAIEFAKEQIENEEDPSKIPERMLQIVQARANEVQTQAFERANKVQARANEVQAGVQSAPTTFANAVKGAMESDDLKKAPGRALGAFANFLQSDEVKQAASGAMKALKDTVESEEMQALQSRASRAVQESLEKKTSSDNTEGAVLSLALGDDDADEQVQHSVSIKDYTTVDDSNDSNESMLMNMAQFGSDEQDEADNVVADQSDEATTTIMSVAAAEQEVDKKRGLRVRKFVKKLKVKGKESLVKGKERLGRRRSKLEEA